jgi:hypothetical protein
MRKSLCGPLRRFAAMQQDVGNRGQTGAARRSGFPLESVVPVRPATRPSEVPMELFACGIRGIADRIPTQAGQRSDDCGQPMMAG